MHRQVEHRLSDREVRYTRGRRAVVSALADADGPLSAAELSIALAGAVPLSSLYRTLAVLEESGVVQPHYGMKGLARYELAEWLTGHHHHLVCVECGTVEDVEVPTEYEHQVTALIEDLARRSSFTPTGHALEIDGLCRDCQ